MHFSHRPAPVLGAASLSSTPVHVASFVCLLALLMCGRQAGIPSISFRSGTLWFFFLLGLPLPV